MAFASAITRQVAEGGVYRVYGTYTSTGGSTGGDVQTGLRRVERFSLQPKGAAVLATQSVVNETIPMDSGAVTIVTTADEVGTWEAIGHY